MKRVGIDFDNTLVCYDEVFSALAWERKLSPKRQMSKSELRDYLRSIGREDDWTELQGIAYGPEIGRAKAFPGAIGFIARCLKEGVAVRIISHKTRHPFRGEKHDLHGAALRWLESQGIFEPRVGLSRGDVFLEATKQDKLNRIRDAGCTHFIDDLPEFLSEPAFPASVDRIHFAPNDAGHGGPFKTARSWSEIERWILS